MKSKKILILVMNSDLYPSTTIVPIKNILKQTLYSIKFRSLRINFKESKNKFISYLIFRMINKKSIPKIYLLDHERIKNSTR